MNELDALRLAGQTSICAYSTLVSPSYKPNRFHRLVATALEKAVREGHGRIIVEAPPRHGKSKLISQDFPAWYMGKHPDRAVIAASYGETLAELNGQFVRDNLGSSIHHQIFGGASMLRADTTAKTHFMVSGGGRYIGTTVRGKAIGFGASLMIIDDPYKDRDEAQSDLYREQIRGWFRNSIYSRLEEKSILAIMHQRWEEDDFAGWVRTEFPGENWTVLRLPAICDNDDDLLGRAIGEALLPDTRSRQWLENLRDEILEPNEWASLYQQQPMKKGSRSVFQEDWYRKHDGISPEAARQMQRYIIVDPARTKNKDSDYTAMAVIGLNLDGNFYVLELLRDKLDLIQRYRELTRLQKAWEPHHVYIKRTGAETEIESMRLFQAADNYRYDIIPLEEPANIHGKNGRIGRLIPDMNKGRWYFPKMAWRKMWDDDHRDMVADIIQEEGLGYPNGKHDDFHDCISGIYDLPQNWPKGSNRTLIGVAQRNFGSLEIPG